MCGEHHDDGARPPQEAGPPTYRGFDTFLGYYKACVQDYWYLWDSSVGSKTNCPHPPCGQKKCDWRTSDGAPSTDFSFDNGTSLGGAPARYNATYNQDVFTGRAKQLISEHDQAAGPLYIYLAYQSIHLGCGGAAYNGTGKPYGVQAPCSTMRSVGMDMVNDTYKVQSAALPAVCCPGAVPAAGCFAHAGPCRVCGCRAP